jgi:S1-C subfamily serine protease
MWIRPLNQDEVKRIGTNNAGFVQAVRRGGPAFTADVLEGDVITELNGAKYTPDLYEQFTKNNSKGSITILRGSVTLTKEIQFGPKS